LSLAGRSVLVTGAEGFIGSHLVERLLDEGARVRGLVLYNFEGSRGWLDRISAAAEVEAVQGDVRDRDSLRRAVEGVEVVFHLAALIAIPYSYDAPLSYVRTNVEGTLNVLGAAHEAGVSLVVHTSTSEVYGTAQSVPISESHPLQAQSPYAASKIGADKIAESYHRSFGLPVTTVRPFNTYGPRQSARAVIPTIATQLLDRGRIELGSLTPTRDFTFVADTVDAFVRAAGQPEAVGRVLNVGSGREISIGALAERIAAILGQDVEIAQDAQRLRPPASEVERLLADATQAHEVLGWSARTTLDDGLSATLEWIRGNRGFYRAGTYQT
jgi:NAD dependent epimerase/dehydratase